MTEIERRVAAAQATLEAFRGKPFRWGRCDCSRIAAAHLRRMGHQVRLPAAGSYGSARGALKALRERGHETLAEALDAMGLERIAPAAALVGDLVTGAADEALGALGVMLGNGRMLGFHEHAAGAAVLQKVALSAAWRVPPLD